MALTASESVQDEPRSWRRPDRIRPAALYPSRFCHRFPSRASALRTRIVSIGDACQTGIAMEFRHFLLQGGNLGARRMTTKARVELSRAACGFCVTQTSSPFQIEQWNACSWQRGFNWDWIVETGSSRARSRVSRAQIPKAAADVVNSESYLLCCDLQAISPSTTSANACGPCGTLAPTTSSR